MNTKKDILITIVLTTLIGLLLYWKYDVSIHRYFDVDEFAHMHWGYNFYSGMKPYSQYLYFFPPLFLFATYPIFALVPKTYALFGAMRMEAFVFFVFLLCGLFLLVKKMRGLHTALISVIILIFLPLPYDKFLEVRPDTLATAFTLFGMYWQVRALQHKREIPHSYFLAGLCYGLAIATVPKVIFFIPGSIVAIGYLMWREKSWKSIIPMLLGGCIPVAITLIVMIWSGDIAKALYLTTSFASNSTRVLGSKFPMGANLFFYPNDTFYGEWGYSAPLVLNLLIYVIAGLWGCIRLMTSASHERNEKAVAEFFVAMTFVLNFIAYVKIFPLKHTQYFISLAPFIAFYFADFIFSIVTVFEKQKRFAYIAPLIILFVAITAGYEGYLMHRIKAQWKDWKTASNFDQITKHVPAGSPMLDLTGESVIYKDPYYICCLPYGQYIEAFSFNLPSMAEALKQTQTAYVYLSVQNRLGILPPQDQVFISNHYVPLLTDPYLLTAGADVVLPTADEKHFEIIVAGEYEVLQQQLSHVEIDGIPLTKTKMTFSPGRHTIKSSDKDEVVIRLIGMTQ
jgi:hypothetical protein